MNCANFPAHGCHIVLRMHHIAMRSLKPRLLSSVSRVCRVFLEHVVQKCRQQAVCVLDRLNG